VKTIRSRDAPAEAGPLAFVRSLPHLTAQRSRGESAMTDRPIVFVVDADVAVRESLELLIERSGWQARTFESAKEFLAQPRVPAPTCMVLDVALPGLSGLDLQKLVSDRTDMPVIFLTGHGDVAMTVQAMKAGALEFLTKPYRPEVLVSAIREALERSRQALAREVLMKSLRESYASLSRREREVMTLVVSGLLNKQVGGELGISEITVKAHRGQVMRKMQADSLAGLVRMAAWLGLPPVSTDWPHPAAMAASSGATLSL
jgi:FixJ family two-component response regulator